jgi:Ca2+-dependent lipid-binding protein
VWAHAVFRYATDIIEGRDLQAMDIGGTSDPYCELFASGPGIKQRSTERRRTKVVHKTLQPTYEERFVFGTSVSLGADSQSQ